MFKKILIANRGEIAVRVMRTAKRLGVKTVAVYSDADRDAPHVAFADEAVHIGPSQPSESYLVIDKIIDAAKRTGAEAIHPGYGFLSENADFADALDKAGIVFIGPTAKTIRAMGSKAAAKDLMEKAGVPTTPGYQGEDQSFETFKRECARIGYPVLLKATAGGGGKGMKVVEREADLKDALGSAQREGKNSFGDARVLVEKYVPRARHLEVQIVGDGKGEVVHFFERDCSVQRRHQKIIEEAPAPDLPPAVRKRLHEIGVMAGKAVDYRGAGTVECLYDDTARDPSGVYFMEMNTRLQVEHPVTEMITGADLVEWQLRVAAGEGLMKPQKQIMECGHAFEARLYAENPDNGFAPSIGRLTTLRLPEALARIDSGVQEGQEITPFYDPMIAKIITNGGAREEALSRLALALEETRVAGLETNARFLHRLATDADFATGKVSTRYIDEHGDRLFAHHETDNRAIASALLHMHLDARAGAVADPWEALTGFRLNKPAKAVYWLMLETGPALARMLKIGERIDVTIEPQAGAAARREGGIDESLKPTKFSFTPRITPEGYAIEMDGATFNALAVPHGERTRIFIGADHFDITHVSPLDGVGAHGSAEGSLVAPMPGVITLLQAEPGATVDAGATLLVMEAMKMEHAIKAPHDGVVKAFRFKAGDQVKEGDLLVEFEEG